MKKIVLNITASALNNSTKKFKISAAVENNIAVIRIEGYISNYNDYAAQFKASLDTLIAQGYKDATVYINSEGGSVFQANEIVNEILRFKGTITAQLGALCASAATYIASSCTKVIIAKNTSYMIHKPSMGCEGNSDELEANLRLLKNMEGIYVKAYSEKTKLPEAKITEMWKQDFWMNATQAKENGFADEIEGEATVTAEDVTAIASYKGAPTLVATIKPQTTENQNQNNMNKELLIMALGLTAGVTDSQIAAAIESLKVKAAKVDALEAQVKTATTEAMNNKAEGVLVAAIAAKKITAAQKEFYKKNLIADFEGTKALIDAMPTVTKLSEQTGATGTGASAVDMSAWTFADYQDKNPMALEALAKDDEAKFKALFKAHYGYDLQ